MKGIQEQYKLKEYMLEHFPLGPLRKAGFFNGISKDDYTAQAVRICERLGIESIYDYHKIGWGTRFHISYEHPTPFTPFVETLGGMKPVLSEPAKVIPIVKSNQLKLF
jgi:hypothetical protein